MNWAEKIVESKAFKVIVIGAFWTTIAIALLIVFMIGSFLFKIYVMDYRFDDGELHPPIEASMTTGDTLPVPTSHYHKNLLEKWENQIPNHYSKNI